MLCPVALAFHYWREFSREIDGYPREWFLRWMNRGLLTPLVVWALMNVGRMPLMPPLYRWIAFLRGNGAWAEAFIAQVCLAGMAMVSIWAVLTFGWFLSSLFKRAKNFEDLIIATVVWSPALLLFWWPFWYVFGWSGSAFGALFWIWPLTHYILNVADLRKPLPTYSQAIAKMKFGKYADAELAIIAQLEKCDTDFDGWMMLADLYATHFHDLAEAEKTICELCDEPTTTLPQVSMALHRLADWQLNLRADPIAARRVLEEICRRMPGTHLALMARHRINQLPHSVKELEAQHAPKKVIMPAWVEELDAQKPAAPLNTEDAMALVNQFVEELKKDPNDILPREKLARVFAGHMGKVDLAVEQLELLIGMPGQSPAKTAEWLGLMATWLLEQHGESEAAQKILERLIHEFPQSPQAFAAQRKLIVIRTKPRGRIKERTYEHEDEDE
ncbi:MAG TPA: tetratricopeptide repeat protein [Verrucomicrobiae bacterium]|nr:tetratricopeptide repeat protein [Verrucomicrobiae bacterium]